MPSLADDLRTAPTTIRPFRPDPFQPAALRRAAERARISAWRVVPITDAATRLAIRDAHLPHWRAHLLDSGGTRIIAADCPAGTARELRAADAFAHELHEAPVHVLLLRRRTGVLRPGTLGALRQALHAEGLDSAPLPLLDRAAPELREVLELPEELVLAGLLVARPRR